MEADLIEFKDTKTVPDKVHSYTNALKNNSVPIIIDNGSCTCRVGWATQSQPILTFKNLIAKPRKERSKKDGIEAPAPPLQVGNDIVNIEAVRFQLKTQFDKNVVTHFEAQENLFDYTFTHLGIDTENAVNHPIVLTEALLNPNSSRQLMSELLFECYNIPKLCLGVDSLFAYHFYQQNAKPDAMILSLGYQAMHVIPIVGGNIVFEHCRRINTGGYHVIMFLHRMLQLKYPAHATQVTLSRAEELLNTVCLVAEDYREELKKWHDVEYYEKHTKRVQLPFNANVNTNALSAEQQRERKRELARRLSEINAKRRGERLVEDEERLQKLYEIQEILEINDDVEEFDYALRENGLESIDDLEKNINLLKMRIEKNKQKMLASNADDLVEEPPNKQARLNKMVFENEKAMLLYVQNAKKMRQEILNKKLARKQKKQDMAKRRTAAGQERMRIISQLARKEKGNDDFGIRDEDWDIYKTISRDGGDSDSEGENEKLMELDEIIKTYDPNEDSDNLTTAEAHQLHIGVERYRAPELLFKPYMIGSSEAGLSEVMAYVLKFFSAEEQLRLAANVVVMGSLSQLPGLKERIQADLTPVRPFQTHSAVSIIEKPCVAPWLAARNFATKADFDNYCFTKNDYEERGPDYFQTHLASNVYVLSPKEQIVEVDI